MNISRWLYQVSSGWLVWTAVIVFALFMIYVLLDQAVKAGKPLAE